MRHARHNLHFEGMMRLPARSESPWARKVALKAASGMRLAYHDAQGHVRHQVGVRERLPGER